MRGVASKRRRSSSERVLPRSTCLVPAVRSCHSVALDVVDWDASEGDSENQDKIMQTVVCEIVKIFCFETVPEKC